MRKIAMIGTAKSAKSGPYADPTWEIWGVSARAACVTRADRWFELHRLDGEPKDWAAQWRETIRGFTHNIPMLVMMYPEPDLAGNVVQYPHDRIVARFGTYSMTSTFAWMMALAIDELRPMESEPVEGRIGIWGVDMEYGTEYRQQRAGFRHFIDLARFAGIGVDRLVDGGLAFEPVPYPMWQDDPLLANNAKRRAETVSNLEEWDASLKRSYALMERCAGAQDELARIGGHDTRCKELAKEYAGLAAVAKRMEEDVLRHRGMYEEQCHLTDYLQA